jgi:hypothetical protein
MISRTDQRHLDDIIRRAIHSVMRDILAPVVETEEFRVRLASAIAARCVAQRVPKPRIEKQIEPIQASAPAAGPWTVGEGSRRRLTEAGLARLAELLPEKSDTQIAAELGITRRAVETRRKEGTKPAATWPTKTQAEREAEAAEKRRAYQREWLRKRREGKTAPAAAEDGVNPKMAEPALAEPKTVAVVPAAVVPAPKVPPAPVIMPTTVPRAQAGALAAARLPRDPQTGRSIPTPAAPMDPAQLEPVPASYEDALDWLLAHVAREGLNMAEVETRLAQLSTKQLLATCNAQRVKAGLSPYVLTERAA